MTPFHFSRDSDVAADQMGIVVPADLKTKSELMNFLFRSIPLPAYFGHNWDALEECLGDLEWLKSEKLTLVHQDIPMRGNPTGQMTYLQILADSARKSERFVVVFPEDCRSRIDHFFSPTA